MNNIYEDSDCEDYPNSRPLVAPRVIVAAVVSVFFVLALVSLVVWLTGRV